MSLFKKLIFGLLFLLSFALFCRELNLLLDTEKFLSINSTIFISILIFLTFLTLTGIFYSIFISLNKDLKILLTLITTAGVISWFLIRNDINNYLSVGFFLSFLIIYFRLTLKLKNYIHFEPYILLAPSIKTLGSLLIIVSSIGFYMSSVSSIQSKGFQLPDELINSALKLMPQSQFQDQLENLPAISSEQLKYLKQNPSAAPMYGIDINTAQELYDYQQNPTNTSFIEEKVKTQINEAVKPYESYIPYLMGLIFFATMQSLYSLVGSILIVLILPLTFYILEKSGFIKYQKEMREVKKMTV